MLPTFAGKHNHSTRNIVLLHIDKVWCSDSSTPATTKSTVMLGVRFVGLLTFFRFAALHSARDISSNMSPKPVAPAWLGINDAGLTPIHVYRNLSVPELIEHALKIEPDTRLMSTGALAATSGDKTGACSIRTVPSRHMFAPDHLTRVTTRGSAPLVPSVQPFHKSNSSGSGSAWAHLPRARHSVAGDTCRADAGRLWFRTILQTLHSKKLYTIMPAHHIFRPEPHTVVCRLRQSDCGNRAVGTYTCVIICSTCITQHSHQITSAKILGRTTP